MAANKLDGRLRPHKESELVSWNFWIASIFGIGCVTAEVYLSYKHWDALNINAIATVIIPICILLVSVWFRTRRYCSQIREISTHFSPTNGEVQDALRTAAKRMEDLLLWLYLINLYGLIYIAWALNLTKHIGKY